MSDKDFLMKTGVVDYMSNTISSMAAEYISIIEETTAMVDELSGHWEGQTYQAFRDGYYSHLEDLEILNDSLKKLSGELYERVEKTRNTVSKIKSILK